jgi:hypothetical protein
MWDHSRRIMDLQRLEPRRDEMEYHYDVLASRHPMVRSAHRSVIKGIVAHALRWTTDEGIDVGVRDRKWCRAERPVLGRIQEMGELVVANRTWMDDCGVIYTQTTSLWFGGPVSRYGGRVACVATSRSRPPPPPFSDNTTSLFLSPLSSKLPMYNPFTP